jgi:hypothetical protein
MGKGESMPAAVNAVTSGAGTPRVEKVFSDISVLPLGIVPACMTTVMLNTHCIPEECLFDFETGKHGEGI